MTASPSPAESNRNVFGMPPVIRAVLWFCGTMSGFAGMAVSARELATEMATVEILFFRSLIGVLVVLPFALRNGAAALRTQRLPVHVGRALVQYGGQMAWIYAVAHLTLANVTAIEFSVPLWVALMAVLFLNERMYRHRWIATGIGFAGVLVILQPEGEAFNLAGLVMVLGAVCYAGSGVLVKYLTRSDQPVGIIFYMNLLQLPLGLVPALFVWVTPSAADAPWLLVWGLSGLGAHYAMARALRLADITVIFPLDFLRLPFMALIGFLFYAEVVDIWTTIGGAVIFAANWYGVREETRLTGRASGAH